MKTNDDLRLLLTVRRHRLRLAAVVLAVFLLAPFYYVWNFELGKAQVAFAVSGHALIKSVDNETVYQNLLAGVEQFERQRLLIFSDAMVSHLIKKFNLYDYYGIDHDDPYAYERVSRAVTERLQVDKKAMDVIGVTYRDRDGRMAVNILNELVAKLESINREEVEQTLERNLQVHEAARNDLAKSLRDKQLAVEEGMVSLSRLHTDATSPDQQTQLFKQEMSLYRQVAELDRLKSLATTNATQYRQAAASLDMDARPLVHVISRAVSAETKTYLVAFGIAVGASIAACIVLLLGIFYYNRYRWIVKTLLR